MSITILIVSIALAWLGYESDWFRIRLPIGETEEQYDMRILATMLAEPTEDLFMPASGKYKPHRGAISPQDRIYEATNRADNLAHFGDETPTETMAKRLLGV